MKNRRTLLSGLFLAAAVPTGAVALRTGAPRAVAEACGPGCQGDATHVSTRVVTVFDSMAEPPPGAPPLLRCPVCGRGHMTETPPAATL
jgi:hypothetical protein